MVTDRKPEPGFKMDNDTELCTQHNRALQRAELLLLRCDRPRSGRYVAIVKDSGVLSLCEVEVFGREVTSE